MTKEIIPWHVFLKAMNQRPRARLGDWLATWRFTDEGVFTQLEQNKPGMALRSGIENPVADLSACNSERRRTLH